MTMFGLASTVFGSRRLDARDVDAMKAAGFETLDLVATAGHVDITDVSHLDGLDYHLWRGHDWWRGRFAAGQGGAQEQRRDEPASRQAARWMLERNRGHGSTSGGGARRTIADNASAGAIVAQSAASAGLEIGPSCYRVSPSGTGLHGQAGSGVRPAMPA